MEPIEQASRIIELGWPVVTCCRPTFGDGCSASWHPTPCLERGKRPLMKGYPAFADQPLSLAELVRPAAGANLAIVTGRLLVAVEADSPEAQAELVALGADGTPTPTREQRPGRGRAYVFRAPSAIRSRAKLGDTGAIDVRGRPGILVVAGLHRTGHRIGWVPGRAPWEVELAELPEGLRALVVRPEEVGRPVVAPVAPSREVIDLPGGIRGSVALLLQHPRIAPVWKGERPAPGQRDETRSGYDYAIARLLLDRRCQPAEVVEALMVRPYGHRPGDADYARRTVEVASRAARARNRRRR